MICHDLFLPENKFSITTLERLGAGAQGEVFRLQSVSNRPGEYVLKLYHTNAMSFQGKHLAAFTQYVKLRYQLLSEPSLALPLRAVVDESQNRVGYIMRMVKGQPLDSTLFHDLFMHSAGLRARLYAAKNLANAVTALHRYSIVSADISEVNLHLDIKNLMVAHTDLDGGGVTLSTLNREFLPNLKPLVRGHMEGSSMAPEMFQDENIEASQVSDRWSLAVMIHKFLFAGLDPYFWENTFQDVLDNKARWPSIQTRDQDRGRYIPFHMKELRRLSPLIRQYFISVFNSSHEKWSPDARPKAEDWGKALAVAIDWVKKCPKCKEEFVSDGLRSCPFCTHKVKAPIIWTNHSCIPIDRQGKGLLGADLGFRDRQGRYLVAIFERQQGKLFLRPQVPIVALDIHHQFSPSEPIYLPAEKQNLTFRAYSNDGNQKSEFRIRVT